MLNAVGMKVGELDRVIVAGQFGAHLKAESIGSGLLPPEWGQSIYAKASSQGPGLSACPAGAHGSEHLAENIQYIGLSLLGRL